MRFRKILRTSVLLFTATLTVVSCITVDKSLGQDELPDDHILNIKTATFDLPIGLQMSDSIQAVSSAYQVFGAINTEEFGMSTFGTAASITPFYTGLRFGESPVVKEVYLLISRSNTQTFTANQDAITQDIYVHRLNINIDSTTLYNNSLKSTDYDHALLNKGTATFGSSDTIKLYLNNSLGEDILKATESDLDTLDNFEKNIKGLYINTATPPAGVIGGRINQCAIGGIILYMKYNFKPTWDTSLPRKDTLVGFYVGSSYCLNTSTYSSKALATSKKLEKLNIEGIGGIKPYIDAQAIKDTVDNWIAKMGYDKSKIIISRATVTLPFEIPANLKEMDYFPTYLFPSHKVKDSDSLTNYYYPFTEVNETGNEKGAINRSLSYYQGDISTTLQYIISHEKADIGSSYNIFLMPIASSTSSTTGSTTYSVDFTNYYIGKINGPAALNKPKLTLLYTIYK